MSYIAFRAPAPAGEVRRKGSGRIQETPCHSMASATFKKLAMFAPA